MARRYEYLFEVHQVFGPQVAYLWTGSSDLTISGQTYNPTNLVSGVSVSGGDLAGTETRVTIELDAPAISNTCPMVAPRAKLTAAPMSSCGMSLPPHYM